MKHGATFVVPVDAEPTRDDGQPICFDWLVWRTIKDSLSRRPSGAPEPLAIAVQHHKNEDQIPAEFHALWDELRASPQVRMESAARWDMASKRMEAQARYGDILIALGGTEGVRFLADLYHAAGKPVIPLNLAITPENEGGRRLYSYGEASGNSRKLFQIADGGNSHDWINRIRFPARQAVADRVSTLMDLLENLERPRAFAVRLLATDHEEFAAVQGFFETVVQPVIEGELGYRLTVIDGRQSYDHARIDEEIFANERFSSREMIAIEQRLERGTIALEASRRHGVAEQDRARALAQAERRGMLLSPQQRSAFDHVTKGQGLGIVIGYAGTGKSAMLGVAREAWEHTGYAVRGAALSGIAAENLEGGSGIASRTIASLERQWEQGRELLGTRDVLVRRGSRSGDGGSPAPGTWRAPRRAARRRLRR